MSLFRIENGKRALAGSVSALALAATPASADPSDYIQTLQGNGEYLSGDKHNHTTCTDGSTSVANLVNESLLVYDLDWFAQTGHGGSGNRDCRFEERYIDGNPFSGGEGDVLWTDTVGEEGILGDDNGGRMWRWQSIAEFAYPEQRAAGEIANKPTWIAVEHIAPGHEHVDVSVYGDQLTEDGDAFSTAQFEYLWDRADDDTTGGEAAGYEDPANNGVEKIDDDETRNALEIGIAGQARAVESVEWLLSNFGEDAYYVPAHVERQGAFDPEGTRGWNVENFRELFNAGLLTEDPTGPSIVFGAEMLAGHQFANGGRGTYEVDRPTAGFGTYGGAGAYSGAEVSVPGTAFDGGEANIARGAVDENGNPLVVNVPVDGGALDQADLDAVKEELDSVFGADDFPARLTEPNGSNQYDGFANDVAPVRVVLGRPGLATMWDALLGEGRKFFNFGSSDWHNRGIFGPFEPQSTLDPYPGEYNKLYAFTEGGQTLAFDQEQVDEIVEGMRLGNSWSVFGDLIDEFFVAMCQGDRCATMGETLGVDPDGAPVEYLIQLRDPEGANNSPYTFPNPSLWQVTQDESVPAINEPELVHVDIVRGDVVGIIEPDDPAYTTNVTGTNVELFSRVTRENMTDLGEGLLEISGSIPAADFTTDMYFRFRGTNMPVGTPNETDMNGNPLLDEFASFIPCPFEGTDSPADELITADARAAAGATNGGTIADVIVRLAFDPEVCPDHLPVNAEGVKFLDSDVEAWSDLWFYANPIFIEIGSDAQGDGGLGPDLGGGNGGGGNGGGGNGGGGDRVQELRDRLNDLRNRFGN